MKDFQEIIDASDNPAPKINTDQPAKLTSYRMTLEKILPYVSPFLLSLVTGPLATASILMQLTPKGAPSSLQAKIKAQPQLQRHILNGIFGDNRIYETPTVNGYKQAFRKLGRQGLRGIYKGNLTGVFMASGNSWVRTKLYSEAGQKGLLQKDIQANLLICSHRNLHNYRLHNTSPDDSPVQTCPSKQFPSLQKSSFRYSAYKSALSVWSAAPKHVFSGGSVLLLKNILFELSWIKIFPSSPSYSFILSTLLSHIVTYPFLVVMRHLQVNDPDAMMMFNRKEKIRDAVGRLWNEGGVRSFYRGFMAHSSVHLFMGALMLQANLRSGFFIDG